MTIDERESLELLDRVMRFIKCDDIRDFVEDVRDYGRDLNDEYQEILYRYKFLQERRTLSDDQAHPPSGFRS